MFITMCQLMNSSYVEAKKTVPNQKALQPPAAAGNHGLGNFFL